MITVTLGPQYSPQEIMDIVRRLRAKGLAQGIDFDFKYNPRTWSDSGFEIATDSHTVFTFYKEKYGTFFALEYGHNK